MLSTFSTAANQSNLSPSNSYLNLHYAAEHDQVLVRPDRYRSETISTVNDEKPIREKGQRVRVNLSGRVFETYMKTLLSREGSIFRLRSIERFFNKEKNEFYFDRNSKAFEGIFTYFQCGVLQKPDNVPYRVFIEELQFFGFGNEAQQIYEDGLGTNSSQKPENFLDKNKYRKLIWNIFENPDYNIYSRTLSIVSTLIIFLSVLVFLIETLPAISETDKKNLDNIEFACVVYFTTELTLRFIVSTRKLRFFLNWMNLIDLVSVVPFYIDLLMTQSDNGVVSFTLLRVLRLARVFRIFKLYRYSKAITLIVNTMVSSIRELFLLLFFVLVIMILFASAVYFFEQSEKSKFKSIPHTFWFCVVTITTVGYGDVVPETPGGKFTASILSVTGVLIIALPIPIIVNNFTRFFEKVMSDSPAYRFEFDPSLSTQITDDDDIFKDINPRQQLVTAL